MNLENRAPQDDETPVVADGATSEETADSAIEFLDLLEPQNVAPQSDDAASEPAPESAAESQEAPSPASEPVVAPESASGDDERFEALGARVDGVAKTEERVLAEILELRKLYHNEFAGRLKSMQDELDRYRKVESGRAFDDILRAIAGIYVTYESLPDSVEDLKTKKEIGYLLEDLKDLVGQYGMTASRTDPDQTPRPKRDPRRCKVAKRLSTDDPEAHDTVAKSYNTGFQIGNRVVVEEKVDIFFYDGKAPAKETNDALGPKNESTAN